MPAKHDFIPSREAELLSWSLRFLNVITAPPGPAAFGLTAAQVAAYATLHGNFKAGYATAVDPNSNSKVNVEIKNTAKAALKDNARMLARLIRATPGVTSAQRVDLGLTAPAPAPGTSRGTPVPTPQQSPLVGVVKVVGRTVRVRVRDRDSLRRRGKPPGCAGAAVFTATGDLPPARLTDWSFQGNATRTVFDVSIADNVPAGSKVWITAQWYNTRGERGPASRPQATYIGEGVSFSGLALAA